MQGTWVQSLVQEDPICLRANATMTEALEPMFLNKRSCHTEPWALQLEKAFSQQQRPTEAKKKKEYISMKLLKKKNSWTPNQKDWIRTLKGGAWLFF